MDRLISEQAVIESIEFFQMNPQHFDFVNLIDDIKDIPSAEPRWIPVSKRLPESDGCYIVTEKSGRVCIYVFHKTGNSEEYWKRCAVAWMPSPQPYKESEVVEEYGNN